MYENHRIQTMKYASHGVLLTIGFLLIGFFVSGSNLAFGLEEDLGASQLTSSMKKLLESKEDMMNVWCAFFIECPEEISESIPLPSRDPQYVSLTDGEIFEKMILDTTIAVDEIEKISLQYEDSDYYELDDPKTMEDLQKIMDLSVDVILDLSPIVAELEFRGYVFHPMSLKDQRCQQTPYIEFPEIKLPEVDATKSELLDWSNQNNQKVIRYNELAQWIYGNNFQNISSDDDKNEIKDITNILQNFEESLVKFEENPTSQNFSNLKDALETIHANSEENDDRSLLVSLDVTSLLEYTQI